MSDLKKQMQDRIKAAMKEKNQHELLTLRTLSAAVKQYEVDSRKDADDTKVIEILQKEIKMRRDALEFAKKEARADLVEQNEREIALLKSFLGDQLSEDALRKLIHEIISSGKKTLGEVMGELNKTHKGQFEGRAASEIAKASLA